MPICIWCKRENTDTAIEHIIPEALGCPAEFELRGGLVCQRCNNGLGHIDQAVIDDFDVLAFLNNVPRKKGRSPAIQNRGNMLGKIEGNEASIAINMENYPISSPIGHLTKKGQSGRGIQARIETNGSIGKVEFSTSIGKSPKFGRGITKIGFSSAVYFLGEEQFYSVNYDPIREYVTNGGGTPRVLMLASRDINYSNQAWSPFANQQGQYAAIVRIAVCEFMIDLSPNCSLIGELKSKAAESGDVVVEIA